jgi:putative ABC transport system permease protein
MRITGQVLLTPSVVNGSVPLGQGAVVSGAALRALRVRAAQNVFLVRFDPEADRVVMMNKLRADFPGTVLSATRSSDIENLRRVDRMPAVLAALFALIALLIVGNMLVSSVRRRRRDLAVMRTMGFVRRQVRATVQWQASLVAFAAIAIGVPLGVVAGRAGWAAVNNRLGLPSDAIIPTARLLLLALGAFVAINVIAIVPALMSTRTPPGGILRSE